MLTALILPSRAAALEAGRLDVAAPEGQPVPADAGIVHAVGVLTIALKVSDRGMHGMTVAGAFVQATGHQFLEDVGGRRAPAEESQLPASAPAPGRRGPTWPRSASPGRAGDRPAEWISPGKSSGVNQSSAGPTSRGPIAEEGQCQRVFAQPGNGVEHQLVPASPGRRLRACTRSGSYGAPPPADHGASPCHSTP